MTKDFATCKECLEDFHIEDMVWGDKGAFYWICERCYKEGNND